MGRWEPNLAVTDVVYGDLAAMTGDAGLREPHQMVDPWGFRNAVVKNPTNILIPGDSFSAGAGITQQNMLSSLLETRYGYSVYNLSFPACGPWQQYINFAIESPRLRFNADGVVIWLLYTGNDLDDDYGDTWNIEDLPWKSGFSAWKVTYKTFRRRSPIRQITDNLLSRLKRSEEMAKKVLKGHLPDGRPVLFLKSQEEWGQRTRAEGWNGITISRNWYEHWKRCGSSPSKKV